MSRTFPPGFPKPTLPMMRFLTALDMVRPELLPVALDSLYAAFWTDEDDVAIGRDRRSNLADPAVFGPILSQVLGQEVVRDGLDRIASPQVKKQLVANTDRALDAGAFGLPWFQCRNARGEVEAFWGFDHLGQVVRFLGLDGRGEIRALL
ncbi:hypothetical protein A1O3_07647 [Capronia epimyces CBS 606.96]|uniref:DSBA-like thioredoxin domain-containing protein n=1 Tax=Capronia epimyces CBS 606.96 TaxID=1182542 RepID=W9XLI4_9EURO|nr:uncharacterized protein A1O3_07647 [Capronia epimyces CBS 606.96]EXJ81357.1 hypothetical protein A1O3_07647 [Capronia epimyces CBS 606.96]